MNATESSRPMKGEILSILMNKAKNMSGTYYGHLTTGGNVEMSLRELQEILAGAKTVSQFEQNYRLGPRQVVRARL